MPADILATPVLQALMYGPLAAYVSEMFGTKSRYTGASLGYQMATTLGGGFAPLIGASLLVSAGAETSGIADCGYSGHPAGPPQ